MVQRVFIKVMGFSDVERHTLNTVFRLSEPRGVIYSPWQTDAPEPPKLVLIDGQSDEARAELETQSDTSLRLIWVGAVAPAHAWRVFERPLSWPDVIVAMDELFMPPESVDFDLGFDTGSADTLPPEEPLGKRALIASPDRDQRLYLRAKLALANLTQVDEAQTGAEALELARTKHYSVALIEFALPDIDGWSFLKQLVQIKPALEHVIFTKDGVSPADRMRARRGGAVLFKKPADPGRLQTLLGKI